MEWGQRLLAYKMVADLLTSGTSYSFAVASNPYFAQLRTEYAQFMEEKRETITKEFRFNEHRITPPPYANSK